MINGKGGGSVRSRPLWDAKVLLLAERQRPPYPEPKATGVRWDTLLDLVFFYSPVEHGMSDTKRI
jgi:hypothetical protein